MKIPRGQGLTKRRVPKLMAELLNRSQLKGGSAEYRAFCRERGFSMEGFAAAAETYIPATWLAYSTCVNLAELTTMCRYCARAFFFKRADAKYCSRKCQATHKRDTSYFAGNRRATVGLAEQQCQLCMRTNVKGLSSHHVLGRSNDVEGKYLLCLCRGCHSSVSQLAQRTFATDAGAWERLIRLCLVRRGVTGRVSVGITDDPSYRDAFLSVP